ncbi:MAG TPA: family 10 glycosylhydrolase, partial [Longimicrobiaceae bacterium]|nr:family 10 glycosylhydrolase [Longimicrobiaceae bacterium]
MPHVLLRPLIRRLGLPLAAALVSACAPGGAIAGPRPADGPPPVRREFRAAWIASVANIDWPSRPGLPVEQQRAELIAMLDSAAALNLNAVVLQVRPAADALYPSALEPWSEYLTGEQGRAPEPAYDPLAFAVAEAHRRGLELHAWFNPYRAFHPSQKSPVVASHISRTNPGLVKAYGKFLWMDPGEPEVQDRTMAVMLDVVRRYDVDGVHIDDYFYPYPEKDSAGARIDFPDSASWARYQARGGHLSRDDWRRDNVNVFIRRMYREVKAAKPWVKVGISPFGIWRPRNPPQIVTSFDQYADMYADARLWMLKGWADYFSPQLYWRIQATPQSYPVLLQWWSEQNTHHRHLWPGNFTSQVIPTEAKWPAGEIVAQVNATRGNPGATGNVHFSMKAFAMDADSLFEKLLAGPYGEPALVPASPWLASGHPGRPAVSVDRGG